MFGAPSLTAQTNANNPNGDVVVASSPSETVTSVHFGTGAAANFLAASSWNKETAIWELNPSTGASTPKLKIAHPQAVLCCAWSSDGTKLFAGAVDGGVRQWTLQTNALSVVGQHSAGVKDVFYIGELNLLVSSSWDKSLRYWDQRQPNPVGTVTLSERVYCADVKGALLVAGTADRKLHIYDIRNATKAVKVVDSPLKFQSRCIAAFPDQSGFAVGSIEGRVGIQHVADRDREKNFAFKCHRDSPEVNTAGQPNFVYSVNAIAFHPLFGTFATCGSDGCYVYWDKDIKQRLKLFAKLNNPITAATFNSSGSIFAYAIGYDWSKGAEFYPRMKEPNAILVHAVREDEVKKKK